MGDTIDKSVSQEDAAIAEAIPSLFALTIPTFDTFQRVTHPTFGRLAVIFTSPEVARTWASQFVTIVPGWPCVMVEPVCNERIIAWCRAERCNGYWCVDPRNAYTNYPDENIVLWAVPDPETGKFIAKGGAA